MTKPVEQQGILSRLVGERYPVTHMVGEDQRRFRRHWIVRFHQAIMEAADLASIVQDLVADAARVIVSTYGQDNSDASIRTLLPSASVVRISEYHYVVVIESPAPGAGVGDAAAIGTWTILRGLDNALTIDDLQGIPKGFWFPMR